MGAKKGPAEYDKIEKRTSWKPRYCDVEEEYQRKKEH